MKHRAGRLAAVAALVLSAGSAYAGTAVSVNINGYLPAPAGVQVVYVGGRPCYREGGRIVYLERDRGHHHKEKGHGPKHHGKHEGEGHGKHHGKHD
ncbi:hypothetical protein GMST_25270 [Geomonas silvestris]|uniref:Uncharacterized protein n=1 Tax=Geomonas silvestris TaxID=2740184 RepID=A0A6V8MJR5_9BACT|nr:hypothetical protein [Geomonas silvestris]GFO60202.1 hypothetical protein GMST_25270 [Geomonas silvestris]